MKGEVLTLANLEVGQVIETTKPEDKVKNKVNYFNRKHNVLIMTKAKGKNTIVYRLR